MNCIMIGRRVALLSGPTVHSLYCDNVLHSRAKQDRTVSDIQLVNHILTKKAVHNVNKAFV